MMSCLPILPLHNARVLLRADLNFDPTERYHYRLQALAPTLTMLREHDAHTLLITHRGSVDEKLSTHELAPLLTAQGFPTVFARTIEEANTLLKVHPLVILQNIRLWPGETAVQNSLSRIELANHLHAITDVYIAEAFAALHRPDCSIVDLPLLYQKNKRTIGLLVEKELSALTQLRVNPLRPFIVFVGGAKIATKLPMVRDLLAHADTVICLPALSFMIDREHKMAIGASLIDEKCTDVAREIVAHAHPAAQLITPEDYLVTQTTRDGPIEYVAAGHLRYDHIGISIGPKTMTACLTQIALAQTVFFAGICGLPERIQTMHEIKKLITALPGPMRISVLAGGDTVDTAQSWGFLDNFSFVSSGGSASLAYVAGQQLVGLNPFI